MAQEHDTLQPLDFPMQPFALIYSFEDVAADGEALDEPTLKLLDMGSTCLTQAGLVVASAEEPDSMGDVIDLSKWRDIMISFKELTQDNRTAPDVRNPRGILFLASRTDLTREEVIDELISGNTEEEKLATLEKLARSLARELRSKDYVYSEDCSRAMSLLVKARQVPPASQSDQALGAIEDALGAYIKSYQPFIASQVKRVKRKGRAKPHLAQMQDNTQEGNLALVERLLNFDLGRGAKFPTYCDPRIFGAAIDNERSRAREDGQPRSTPKLLKDFETKMDRAIHEGRLAGKTTREIEIEVAEGMKVPIERIDEKRNTLNLRYSVSLDAPINGADMSNNGDSETLLLGSTIVDPKDVATEAVVEAEGIGLVDIVRTKLDEQQSQVVAMYYGLPPFKVRYSLKEIGVYMGLTESRICQIHTGAKKRLRNAVPDSIRELVQ